MLSPYRVFIVAFSCSLLANTVALADSLPEDILSFEKEYKLCEHFRGEHTGGSSPERDREVNQQIQSICPAVDQSLIRLRTKYRSDQRISSYLRDFVCSSPQINCNEQ